MTAFLYAIKQTGHHMEPVYLIVGIVLIFITILLLQFLYLKFIKNRSAIFSLLNFSFVFILSTGIITAHYFVSNLDIIEENKTSFTRSNEQYKIGRAFYNGQLLPKDNFQAVSWLLLAAEQGSSDAEELLHTLGYFYANNEGEQEGVNNTSQFNFIPSNKIQIGLKDVAGQKEAKEELRDLLTFIKEPGRYVKLGARAPKGILLYGPPGTGKTLLAKAVAGEAKVNFIATSGAAFEDQYVGVGAARIRELFKLARDNKPCIIFIDELDALAASRKGDQMSPSQIQTINQLLQELSPVDDEINQDIFLIGATNRLESLDGALLRPGRFDRQVYVRLPSLEDRQEIIAYLIKKLKYNKNIDITDIAQKTSGFSGAELDAMLNESAIFAGKSQKNEVDIESVDYAIKKISLFERDPSPNLQIKILSPYEIKTSFDDIAGMNQSKQEVKDIVDYLKTPNKYKEIGAKVPKGVLIYGPPGTGKTLMARAMAGEAGVTFLAVSGSDFDEKYVGVGASRVRELFKTARKFSPCIVFIDEVDVLAQKRGGSDMAGQSQTINQLLSEMDNIQEDINDGIIFVAATNKMELMDEAILRPGRFDRKVYFRLPSIKERVAIIKQKLSKVKYAPEINVEKIARTTPNFSGADLESLINEAAIYASNQNLPYVDSGAIEYAKDKIVLGVDLGTGDFSEKEIALTAYHEAGHALVGLLHPDYPHNLHKATVGLRGHSLGVTYFEQKDETFSSTKKELEAMIAVKMGGLVAEQLTFGPDNVTTGASSDLLGANQIVKDMVQKYAMDDKQSLIVNEVFGGSADKGTERAEKILQRNFNIAKSILMENKNKLKIIAEGLIDNEILSYDEIKKMIDLK
jgi:cell division protease FtsH